MITKAAITIWLNEPIARKKALTAVSIAYGSTLLCYVAAKETFKEADEILEDLRQRNKILLESTNFLLEHADDATIVQLNKDLDFWRVIRGISPTEVPDE